MAAVNLNDDDDNQIPSGTAPPSSSPAPAAGPLTSAYQKEVDAGTRDAADLGAAQMIDRDRNAWEGMLKQGAAEQEQKYGLTPGSLYNSSDLEGVIRNASYARNAGVDPRQFINSALDNYVVRAASGGDRDAGGYDTSLPDPTAASLRSGSVPQGPRTGTGQPYPYPGGTFSDPWTKQLEDLITQQLNAITNPSPDSAQSQLTNFLMQRFKELSSNPGYSPQEQALLNTQALEPIEDLRAASNRRAIENASVRGFLPSSGLTHQVAGANGIPENVDTAYDRMRTVANRDLGINAINKRNQDLATAVQLGQGAVSQDQNVRNQALQLATLLYQLPINAQNQALSVINGTGSPSSLLPYIIQMAQANQNNSAGFWSSIGALAGL